ncbi:AraC family transcriptional regulator [Paenibacillus septentrionalis]
MMSDHVQQLPNYRIAYLRKTGPYGLSNYEVMTALKAWAKRNNLLTASTVLLGISLDNPQYVSPKECRYDASIVIDEHFTMNTEDTIEERMLLGGTYFVHCVKHTPEHIQQAWNNMMSMIDHEGLVIDHKPIIERYIGIMNDESYCEICVPIIQ